MEGKFDFVRGCEDSLMLKKGVSLIFMLGTDKLTLWLWFGL
jgi:hypothetical protein